MVSLTSSAIPPVQTTTGADTLFVEYPKIEYIQSLQSFEIYASVFNQTGYPMTNASVSCTFAMTFRNGTKSMVGDMNWTSNYFYYDIPAQLITNGKTAWLISCFNGGEGGFASGLFFVTPTGFELTQTQAILNLGFLILIAFFFILTIFAFGKLGNNETRDDYGQILSLDSLKYFKGFLVAVAYALLIALFFTASNIALAYLNGEMFGQLLFIIYKILMWITIPFIVVWLLWLFVNIFKDRETRQLLERGVQIGDI